MRLLLLVGSLCLALSLAARAQGLHQFEEEFVKITEQVRPSVVQVTAVLEGHSLAWSGVVLSAEGHIVTAGHMLAHLERFRVHFLGGRTAEAKRLGYDPVTSLGVLKVEPGEHLRPVKPARLDRVRVGSLAIVVGNPFGFSGSVSTGIISGTGRTIESGRSLLHGMLQTTAPINPGDSGGLVANSRGEMVGIVTSTFGRGMTVESMSLQMQRMLKDRGVQQQMKALMEYMRRQEEFKKDPQKLMEFLARWMKEFQKSGAGPFAGPRRKGFGYGLSAQGINFVLPADQVASITAELIRHGKLERGWLGVSVGPSRTSQQARLVVDLVVPEGPAARAGVVEGDELLQVAGRPIASMQQLSLLIQRSRPGEELELVLRRGTKELRLRIKLGRRK